MHEHTATFRFYAELNDFLPPERRQRTFAYAFLGKPAIKDAIEALGIPHTEVDLILVNGTSVEFDWSLREGDRVAVYPVFESLNIGPVVRVRDRPLRATRFVLDVHLGKLARLLRLLGFDTLYRNDYEDAEIVAIAGAEQRIVLTRDVGLLKHKAVTHGYWVRATEPLAQAREVIARFDLADHVSPYRRCLRCNGELKRVDKAAVISQVPPHVAEEQNAYLRCTGCGRVYWRGSHFHRLEARIAEMLSLPAQTGA